MYSSFTHSLYRSQSETDIAFGVDGELQVRLVHIRAKHFDAHGLTLVHEFGDSRYVGQTPAHYGSHVLCRIVGFQESSLIGHPGIASGMRLIEGIGCKLLPVRPNLFEHLRIMPVLLSTRNKFRLHVIQLVTQLLTHCLTQGIGLTAGEVRQQTGQKHHLLLVDGDAVRIFQVFLHYGNIILDRLASPLTVDEVRDIVHRARTIEGVHGYQVLESTRLQLTQVFLHACGLELERTDSPPVAV